MLTYHYQLQDVGEKEISVFTVLKLLCKVLFENSNISVGLGAFITPHTSVFRVRALGPSVGVTLPCVDHISIKSPPSF